jgi:SAM-dependent methyltransferase
MQSRYELIKEWFSKPISPVMEEGELLENFHRQHPSKVFLRSLPRGARVLDIGAGDGGLSNFKQWPSPGRPDLKLYAFSLEKGRLFDQFDGYELGNWNTTRPSFGGMKFDAIHCANFIEHIDDPKSVLDWAAQNLEPWGRLYIEWPSDDSQFWPNLKELHELGFDCVIGNYFDDPTHKHHLPTTEMVESTLTANGFAVESRGIINMPILADELLNHYRAKDDVVSLQLAYWLKTGWIQYMVAQNSASLPDAPNDEIRKQQASIRPPDFSDLAVELRAAKAAHR